MGWGYARAVSTTRRCTIFRATRSLSRLWPIRIVSSAISSSRAAWTSSMRVVTPAMCSTEMPLYCVL